MPVSNTILRVRDLSISFRVKDAVCTPVRGVSFDVSANGRVALVGESGCGKSLTALAIGGLVERADISGTIEGKPRLSYIFQNPMHSLNPVMRIGRQIGENLPAGVDSSRIDELLEMVALPASASRRYPCELSGGQQQRAMIAMALAAEPDLLIADEPTTALDVTTQKEVLDLIDRLADAHAMAVLLITHNLGLVSAHSREMHVMYAGQIVESGDVRTVLSHPRHPYTRGLLGAVPSLDAPKDAPLADIPGTVPPPTAWPPGCAFHPRCPHARSGCSAPDFVRCPEMD